MKHPHSVLMLCCIPFATIAAITGINEKNWFFNMCCNTAFRDKNTI